MLNSLLNRNIIIEKETTTTNPLGTPVEEYSFLKETKAFMKVNSGDTEYNVTNVNAFTVVEFTIRYDSNVDYKCRIQYENQYYKINHIQELERRRFQKIKCILWDN